MKNNNRLALVILTSGFALSMILGSFVSGKSHAQASREAATPAEKVVVDQHWRIVPDVLPSDLQRQLKLLNEAGITVDQKDIVLVGDKFTIMISDGAEEESGE